MFTGFNKNEGQAVCHGLTCGGVDRAHVGAVALRRVGLERGHGRVGGEPQQQAQRLQLLRALHQARQQPGQVAAATAALRAGRRCARRAGRLAAVAAVRDGRRRCRGALRSSRLLLLDLLLEATARVVLVELVAARLARALKRRHVVEAAALLAEALQPAVLDDLRCTVGEGAVHM